MRRPLMLGRRVGYAMLAPVLIVVLMVVMVVLLTCAAVVAPLYYMVGVNPWAKVGGGGAGTPGPRAVA